MLRIALAVLHLLALGVGFESVWARGRALRAPLTPERLTRAFVADTWWGVAALLWITTGLWRLFAGTEKPTGYYLHNNIFFAKMGLLALILAVEIWPMITLIRWRIAQGRGTLDVAAIGGSSARISAISYVQCVLVVGMVVAAVMMARGYGLSV